MNNFTNFNVLRDTAYLPSSLNELLLDSKDLKALRATPKRTCREKTWNLKNLFFWK